MAFEDSIKKEGKGQATDLEIASADRLDDARALMAAGRPAAAISASTYSLEILLKVLICKNLKLATLPKAFEFHDLEALLIIAGLKSKLNTRASQRVQTNWLNIARFLTDGKINDLRYSPDRNWPIEQARAFLLWLEDPKHGVLTWLSKQK